MGCYVNENKLELLLITDVHMSNKIEKMKRGGLSFVGSERHVKANAKHYEGFTINQNLNIF